MNDLGTNVEHIEKRYLWRIRKHGQRVHIENPETERACCQVENCGGRPLDGKGEDVPPGRRLCQNCADLAGRGQADYREPDLRVLLGEKLAESEPELFAGLLAPEPERTYVTSPSRRKKWKRRKQARPAHRSKWGKPKRSDAKYPRPFDDDLPW